MSLFELNRLFAFEGASPLVVAGACALFLEEKITMRAWFASFLIAIGITLVALFQGNQAKEFGSCRRRDESELAED
jgi:drug/metabolite transporter (DMT)-like permease